MSREIELYLNGLNCANCANKIELNVRNLVDVEEANLNFSVSVINVKVKEGIEKENVIKKIEDIVKRLEPHVEVVLKEKFKSCIDYNRNECRCDNDKKMLKFLSKNSLLILGAIVYIVTLIFNHNDIIDFLLFLTSYILVGWNVLLTSIRNIFKGEIFDENFLMSVATVGAISIGEYPEAIAVMIFYELGEMFQDYAVNNSRKSIKSLMNIRAEYANLVTDKGERKVSPESIRKGDLILIKPGERVPVDGIVLDGNGEVDMSALTGESIPKAIYKDQELLSGSINLNSVLKVKVTKELSQSTISKILDMVENASSKKAPIEKYITRFCRYYTPIVVLLAILLVVVPPIIYENQSWSEWIYKSLSFLVVSCPCALVVSVPLTLFSGIGKSSKSGVLVKGGNYLEALSQIETVVFDKTGTLTKGNFKVSRVKPINISKDELLKYAAICEYHSNHPIAKSILKAYSRDINHELIQGYNEVSGYGIKSIVNRKIILAGNYKFMLKNGIKCSEVDVFGTVVYIAIDNKYSGYIVIEDEVKEDSKEAIDGLRKLGIKNIVMLTGDQKKVADYVGKRIGIEKIHSELLPIDKVEKLEMLINNSKGKVAFVGDGINDAPVLARADIGIAMGGIGSDAAIEAADVVLMKDNPISLVESILISKKTNRILLENIIFSLSVKIGVLIFIFLGVSGMWQAVFADVGVTLIAVFNSIRALK